MLLGLKKTNPRLQLPAAQPGHTIVFGVSAGTAMPNEQAKELLALLVAQAMHDGMNQLHLGIGRGTAGPFLRYGKSADHHDAEWWDMTPPPPDAYPVLFKAAISLASLNASLPFVGGIEVVKGGKTIELQLEVHDLYSFTLSWPSNVTRC